MTMSKAFKEEIKRDFFSSDALLFIINCLHTSTNIFFIEAVIKLKENPGNHKQILKII